MKKFILMLLAPMLITACGGGTIDTSKPEKKEAPSITQEDCFNDTVIYEVSGTPLKFCYNEEWGAPVIEGTAEAGKVTVSFDRDGASPWVSYVSTGYGAGEEDVFCYDCIFPVLPEEKLAEDFSETTGLSAENFILRKVQVFDTRGIRVHYVVDGVDSLIYYVPNAFEGYHLEIGGPYEMAVEVDDMAQWMVSF